MNEGDLLWKPGATRSEATNLYRYMRWLEGRGHVFNDYASLWQWSIDEEDAFWSSIWKYFDLIAEGSVSPSFSGNKIGERHWFPNIRLNLAENILRHAASRPNEIAIHHRSEQRAPLSISWAVLAADVQGTATALRGMGIGPGDRVACYMPNIPEAIVAMLATIAIGATWSATSPEFGVPSVVDRFAQIEPRAIFAVDSYGFGGKSHDRRQELSAIVDRLPSIEQVILFSYGNLDTSPVSRARTHRWEDVVATTPAAPFLFERVPHGTPLWIVFSSGTTGLPRAIVHGHVEMTIDQIKAQHLHADLAPGKTLFFHATTAWVVWHSLVCCLLTGCSIVTYDGNPLYPDASSLWKVVADTRCTSLGLSPGLIRRMEQAGLEPGDDYDLDMLEAVMLGGAPSTPETFAWLYAHVGADLWVYSHAGSTELPAGFVGGVPLLPVRAGEIQNAMLGVQVDCLDEAGNSVIAEVGDLVIRNACPAMPISLWNDVNSSKLASTYLSDFPGLWRQGDLFKLNSDGGCYIYGRSDAVLNRNGIRIGSGEIYRTLEQFDGIRDSIIVGTTLTGGREALMLFVVLNQGHALNRETKDRINDAIRVSNSPRHIPDHIMEVPAIPYNITGKKLEVPLRHILEGVDAATVVKPGSLADPRSIDWYVGFAREMLASAQ